MGPQPHLSARARPALSTVQCQCYCRLSVIVTDGYCRTVTEILSLPLLPPDWTSILLTVLFQSYHKLAQPFNVSVSTSVSVSVSASVS
jgi:hypothetical protein